MPIPDNMNQITECALALIEKQDKDMYKFIIYVLLFSLVLYYALCFLEILKVIKFTKSGIVPTKLWIPFYYLFKN